MTLDARSVVANGIRLHYLRSPRGDGDKPPLVLAHGFSDSGACWASLVRVLERDWDVVAYDARGHGRSDAPETGYSGEDQAADVLGLCDALGLERPVLMGHSMGGETVAWAAIQRPEAVRAVVLEDSGLHWPDLGGSREEQQERVRKGLSAWIRSLQGKTVDELVALVAQNDPRWPEEDRLPWAESKLALSDQALDGFALAKRRDITEHYAGLLCPALFLKADAPEDERARHRQVVATLADGEIVHVDGAGHNVRRDEQARTVYHLGHFLARV